jgi:hypothetical protein
MAQDGVGPLPRKERLILELLASLGPQYGLQLVDHSDGALKRGAVYVTLGRMEAKGVVESQQEPIPPGGIGLPRRIYRPEEACLRGRCLCGMRAIRSAVCPKTSSSCVDRRSSRCVGDVQGIGRTVNLGRLAVQDDP